MPISERKLASGPSDFCSEFNSLNASAKLEEFNRLQGDSISTIKIPYQTKRGVRLKDSNQNFISKALAGNTQETFDYIDAFILSQKKGGQEFFDALAATFKFVQPSHSQNSGYKTLKPTFLHECEIQKTAETKKVHALGSLASAQLKIYPELIELDKKGRLTANKVANRFTGVLGQSEEATSMLLRFSIANPVVKDFVVHGQSLSLEFIPGLGMKFLLDQNRSVDLVAMDSLAGQASDHNYFKYEFSPDFSKHAPSSYNSESDPVLKNEIMKRYDYNKVNHHVMNLVGKRFAQVIPEVTKFTLEEVEKNHAGVVGPHPFIISISELAKLNSKGESFSDKEFKRPWRLVFSPALDNIEIERVAKITDSKSYVVGNYKTDFRHKLGYLKTGDRIYYVNAQNENGKTFRLGEITLTSAALPSVFSDDLYFIQHKLDLDRKTSAIIDL